MSVVIDEAVPRARMHVLVEPVGKIDVELHAINPLRVELRSVSRDLHGKPFFPPIVLLLSDLLLSLKRCVEWSLEPASKPLSPEETLSLLAPLKERSPLPDSPASANQ